MSEASVLKWKSHLCLCSAFLVTPPVCPPCCVKLDSLLDHLLKMSNTGSAPSKGRPSDCRSQSDPLAPQWRPTTQEPAICPPGKNRHSSTARALHQAQLHRTARDPPSLLGRDLPLLCGGRLARPTLRGDPRGDLAKPGLGELGRPGATGRVWAAHPSQAGLLLGSVFQGGLWAPPQSAITG